MAVEKLKAVIIDDELNSRELLTTMLNGYCEKVDVVGTGKNVKSGIKAIQTLSPDIVFLDIEMPGGNGFKILDAFSVITFKVIFITGYDQYAIKAIKYAALDYILKPVDLTELRNAVKKVSSSVDDHKPKIQFLKSTYNEQAEKANQLIIPGRKGYTIIKLGCIVKILAEGNYSRFYLDDQRSVLSSYSLSHYKPLLPKEQFFRIHKSYIVNLNKVVRYEKGRGGKVFLSDSSHLDIAARRKREFVKVLGKVNFDKKTCPN